MENSTEVPKKLEIELLYEPAIPFPSIYPDKTLILKRYMHPYVQWVKGEYPSTIQNSQDTETA